MFCIDAFKEFTTSKSYLCFEYDRLTSKELSGFDRLLRKIFGCYANTRLSHVIHDGYKSSLSTRGVTWDPDLQNQWFCLVHKHAPNYAHEIPGYQLGNRVVHVTVTYNLNDIMADRPSNAQKDLEETIKSQLLGNRQPFALSPALEARIQSVLEARIQGWIHDWADETAQDRVMTEIENSLNELQGESAIITGSTDILIELEDWHHAPTVRKINSIKIQFQTEGGGAQAYGTLTVSKHAGKLTMRSPYRDSPFGCQHSLDAMNAVYRSDTTTIGNHLVAKIVTDSEGVDEMHCPLHDYENIIRRVESALAENPALMQESDEQQPSDIARAPNYGYDDLPAALQARQEEQKRSLGWQIDERARSQLDENSYYNDTIPYYLDSHAAEQIAPAGSTPIESRLSLAFAFPLLVD